MLKKAPAQVRLKHLKNVYLAMKRKLYETLINNMLNLKTHWQETYCSLLHPAFKR